MSVDHSFYPEEHNHHKSSMITAESQDEPKKRFCFKISFSCRSEIFVNKAFCGSTLHKYVLKALRELGGFGKMIV